MRENGTDHRHTNHLIHEQSPYLLQHAHNPVSWYPWNETALQRAREENKPIFLSIGYSTCHWCHVMERESFESEAIAALMNEHFICIKVDREERPDLDEIYMAAVQAMTGQGGWPMSVFLTPDLKPFFGGTYFPPEERFGRPGFPQLLAQLHHMWETQPERLSSAAEQLSASLAQLAVLDESEGEVDATPVRRLYEQISASFDRKSGGWGSAPKFPRSDFGSLCLRRYREAGDETALTMALRTLQGMAEGGIFDHLGGGFARYSTDGNWLVPHFEKMLYDNAQLTFHYLEAYQLTGEGRFAEVAAETLDYVLRDLRDPLGGFYCAEDADSEGEEGKFYVWQTREIQEALPPEIFGPFRLAYGVSEGGNWEGANILYRAASDSRVADELSISVPAVRETLKKGRQILFSRREGRIRPQRDDKVLSSWNGLMIRALARAGAVLQEDRYLNAATEAADFILREMIVEGTLKRRWRRGKAGIDAYCEDYAMLVCGLLELYQDGFEPRFFAAAKELHDAMMRSFAAKEDGALFNTKEGQTELLVRVKMAYDGPTPSANSVAAANMLGFFELTGDEEYARQLERILHAFWGTLSDHPAALASMVLVLESYLAERTELVLSGSREEAAALLHHARSSYHPHLFVSHASGEASSEEMMPPLAGKSTQNGATAYVCRAFTCQRPSMDPELMATQLGGTRSSA